MGNLVSCPDCRNEVSRSAMACPRCGRPLRESVVDTIRWAARILALIAVGVAAVAAGFVWLMKP